MPDVTLCDNYKCPLRDMCYRYRAVPNKYWQSFSHFTPVTFPLGSGMTTKCDHFWNIEITGHSILPTEEGDKRTKGGDND